MTRAGPVAEATILYDAAGNAVQVGPALNGAAASSVQAAQGQPVVTPAQSQTVHQIPVTTTQQVQAAAEYADGGDVLGGDTFIPFGPTVRIEQDPENPGQDIDPGFRYAWTKDGARRTFRIAGSIGLMPLLRFAHSAKAGLDTDDLEGMAALYTMIQDCVHPDDWAEFQEYATVTKAEDEDLMEFVGAAMEVITARPRKRRGSSSASSPNTSQRSRGGSSKQGSVIPAGAIRPAEFEGLMPVGDLVN